MQLKNFLDYLKYSGIWITFAVNPYHWRVACNSEDDGFGLIIHSLTIGPLTIKGVVDNGKW